MSSLTTKDTPLTISLVANLLNTHQYLFQDEELPGMPLPPSIATMSLAAMYVQTPSTARLSHEGGYERVW